MEYRLDVVLHNYNFKTREDDAGSIKVHIQAWLDSHTQILNKTRELQVNIDLSSMVLSRENQKCVHRDKYIQTQNGLYEHKFRCTQRRLHICKQMQISANAVTDVHVHMCHYTHTEMYTEAKIYTHTFILIPGPSYGGHKFSSPSQSAIQLLVIHLDSFPGIPTPITNLSLQNLGVDPPCPTRERTVGSHLMTHS
jgi:hypothetical protein